MLDSVPVVVCLATAFIELDVGAKPIEVTFAPWEAVPMATLFPFRCCAGGSSCTAAAPGSPRARDGAGRPFAPSMHWMRRLGP